MSLGFLPEDHVINTFNEIVQEYNQLGVPNGQEKANLDRYFQYWLDTWSIILAKFNVYYVDSNRTSNMLEGFHHYLLHLMGRRSNFWKFIDHLKELESKYATELVQIEAGQEITIQRKMYVDLEAKLTRFKNQYRHNVLNDLQYVTRIAYATSF